jgi:RNA polymerase sigma factor (sigma-70 family)
MTASNELNWGENYPQLYKMARRIVGQMRARNWLGQEEDIAWDVVQETMRKLLKRVREAENGEKEPVESLEAMFAVTAKRCAIDMLRREKHVLRETVCTAPGFVDHGANFSEEATENAYHEHIFRDMAHAIASFPPKQRRALLSDLAERMAFGKKPTTLQEAFRAEGIRLEEYRRSGPLSELERARNAALLHQAYRRLQSLGEIKKYQA